MKRLNHTLLTTSPTIVFHIHPKSSTYCYSRSKKSTLPGSQNFNTPVSGESSYYRPYGTLILSFEEDMHIPSQCIYPALLSKATNHDSSSTKVSNM
jgi:hypothetical protein